MPVTATERVGARKKTLPSLRSTLRRGLIVAGLCVALLWPAICNHGPFYFFDTRTYMRNIEAALVRFVHATPSWTAVESAPATAQTEEQLHDVGQAHTRTLSQAKKKGIMLGRSLYYGLLLYLGAASSGFWLTAVLQAAAILLAIALTLRTLAIPMWPALAWVTLALAAVSDVGFFVSYMMPDLFAGVTVLACAILLGKKDRLAGSDAWLWFLLLSFSTLAHESCILMCTCLLAFAVSRKLIRRDWKNWRALLVVVLATATGICGESLVNYGITRATGQQLLRWPIAEARMIADGPGTRYLQATCPQSGFVLCDYVQQFPMSSTDFLFNPQPGKGVYEPASYEQRRALTAEQSRFLIGVYRYDPAGVLRADVHDALAQFFDFTLSDFSYDSYQKDVMDRTFPYRTVQQIDASAAYRGTLPTAALTVVFYVLFAASALYLGLAWFGFLPNRGLTPAFKSTLIWLAAGIVLNAVLCGCLSTNEPRYQARVVWVLPLLALCAEAYARFDCRPVPAKAAISS